MNNPYIWVNAIFVTIILTLFLGVLNRIKKQKIHLYIYTVVWAILVFGNQIIGPPYLVSLETLIVVYLAWITFYLGSIFIYLYYANEHNGTDREVVYSTARLKMALYFLIVLSIIANYLFFQNAASKLQGLANLAMLRSTAARDVLTESNMFYNLFGRSYNIYIPMAFLLYNKKKLPPYILAIIVIIALATSASTFTRAPILNVLICILVSVVLSGKKIRLNAMTASLVLGFVGLLSYLTNEINTKLSLVKVKNADELFVNTIYVYIFGGIRAYQDILEGLYIDHKAKYYDAYAYSLDFLNYFLKRLGFIEEYPGLIREYMRGADIPTNVYTYLDCFTLDLGIVGALLGSTFLGIITTYIAVQAHYKRTITMTTLYCFCCFGMSIIFMNNEFIRNTAFLMLIPLALVEFIARFNMNSDHSDDAVSVI
jgi:oligosaccharide repeat unit polymerase